MFELLLFFSTSKTFFVSIFVYFFLGGGGEEGGVLFFLFCFHEVVKMIIVDTIFKIDFTEMRFVYIHDLQAQNFPTNKFHQIW